MYGKPEITINEIVCEECRKEFKKITSAHLKKWHGLTIPEYKEKWGYYRTQPLEALYITKLRSDYAKEYKADRNLDRTKHQFKKGRKHINYPCEQRRLKLKQMNESEAHAKALKSTDCKQKRSIATKKLWQNPKYRKAQIAFTNTRKRTKKGTWIKTNK